MFVKSFEIKQIQTVKEVEEDQEEAAVDLEEVAVDLEEEVNYGLEVLI